MHVIVILSRFARAVDIVGVRRSLERHLCCNRVRFLSADSRREAYERALEGLQWGADGVLAVGGDGTANGVINAVAGTGVVLGIVPSGTANDLARFMNLPDRLEACCEALRSGCRKRIDLIRVNGAAFATAGGIGLAAETIRIVDSIRNGGPFARFVARSSRSGIYALGLVPSLLRLTRQPIQISARTNGSLVHRRVISLLIANQAFLGRRFLVAPGAVNSDGLGDVSGIAQAGLGRNLLAVAGTLGLRSGGRTDVFGMRTSHLEIEADREVPFAGDGEILALSSRFEIAVEPSALVVAVPTGSQNHKARHPSPHPSK